MKSFVRHTVSLFLALRVADLINLACGLYLVPKFVSPNELGAVLPVSTFATAVSIPAFAFAMVFMREGSVLAARKAWGEWKSLVRGVFVATGALLLACGLVAAFALPRYLRAVGVADAAVGSLVIAGAFLGCVAPVYSDALNALRRFTALGAVEIASALARLATLAVLMPFRALAGYFAGGVVQPLARMAASVFLIRRELAVPAAPFWTRAVARRLVLTALAMTAALAAPLLASLADQSVLRISLGADDSAAYYLLTRLSGLLDYLTLPLILVLFPHAAAEEDPRATRRLVLGCEAATFGLALGLILIALLWGQTPHSPLELLPNGAKYAASARYLPILILIGALNAGQVFATNAALAAGRFRFLVWFVPLNLAYAALLTFAPKIVTDIHTFLLLQSVFALVRFALAQTTLAGNQLAPRRLNARGRE